MRSALVSAALVGVLSLAAGGQPPPPVAPPKAVPPKPAPAMEDDIAKALRTHPDVLVAEAAAQLANAKLQQSKLAVAGKVTAAKREKDRARIDVGLAETRIKAAQKVADTALKQFEFTKKLHQSAQVSAAEMQISETAYQKTVLAVVEAEQVLQTARLALAAAEADYDALVGNSPAAKLTAAALVSHDDQAKVDAAAAERLLRLMSADVKPGSVADKLRTALAKPIAFECKGERLDTVVKALKALAGTDVMIRMPSYTSTVTLEKMELTFGAWLELVRDEWNTGATAPNEWYVREYGLTFSPHGRPEGAVTLGEFLKAMAAEKKADAPKKH